GKMLHSIFSIFPNEVIFNIAKYINQILQIDYIVITYSHDGYCSGAIADTKIIRTMRGYRRIVDGYVNFTTSMEILKYMIEGTHDNECSGSGYCDMPDVKYKIIDAAIINSVNGVNY